MGNFCSKCRKELNDNAKFCDNCGSGLNDKEKIKSKKCSKRYFIVAVCFAILSIISMFLANYLNETALSGNAKAVIRSMGSSAEIAQMNFKDTLQTVSAYGFVVFLIIAIVLLVIGIILNIKEKSNK